jgi:hypothetical protein
MRQIIGEAVSSEACLLGQKIARHTRPILDNGLSRIRYFSRYFFLGGVAIFASEGADATFGFPFFGFLVSRLLRT